MNTYHINKGIGRKPEFKGLKAQYLFIFAGGLLLVLLLIMMMYMVGIHTYICLSFGGICGGILTWVTFYMNRKYGMYGLMKIRARKKHPRYIISRKLIKRLIQDNHQKFRV
ncbi:conjugal transfer protein TraF [Elizabethkingia anophelis]|nr:conjugal transfer protein TraF [Elizabethkingia anophelis]